MREDARSAAESLFAARLQITSTHLPDDVLSLPQRQGDDRQRGIGRSWGAQGAAVGHEEVGYVMRSTVWVRDSIARVFAHSRRAHVVCSGRLP